MNTSVTAVLYTSKTLSNGQHPLMLRLSKNRKLKYISLHLSLDAKFWDTAKGKPKRNCPDRDKIIHLIELKTKEIQEQIIDFKTNDKDYTLHTLIKKASKPAVRQTVADYLDSYIDRLATENRIGNAKTFKELRTSLLNFCKSLDFYFLDIDTDFLKRYAQWMRTVKSYSDNTMGIRLRSLRALYNSAVSDNLVRKANYPFDDFKVSQFKEQTAKRSIGKEHIKQLIDFEPSRLQEYQYSTPFLTLAKDLFLFSYFGCGINLTDILHLTYKNVTEERITFHRQKTGKLISFQLQPTGKEFIEKYRSPFWDDDDYIFPVLNRYIHITAEQQYGRVQRVNK
ncbi:MAG: site-specific integrase, partial [Rikenellaceae bacterium]|nr:site-specific integrase [Rikenellaceae bacterium]